MSVMVALLAFVLQIAPPRPLTEARRLYDAGKYREAVDVAAAAPTDGPDSGSLVFLSAQSRQKLNDLDGARQAYLQLSGRADTDAWRFVGQSALFLMDKRIDEAVSAASQAVTRAPALAEAQFQLGLAYTSRNDSAGASAAFDKAAQLDPTFAYASYYAGLSYYKLKRIDLTAARFESFLKLAPNAPERAEVESIMRTLRGR